MKYLACLIIFLWAAADDGLAQNVGIGTETPLARLHVSDGTVVFAHPNAVNFSVFPPVQGIGARLMWFHHRIAFRAGYVFGTEWDRDSLGIASVAMGANTKAIGGQSTALGYFSVARGDNSLAAVNSALAQGHNAVSIGVSTKAVGNRSIAMGTISEALGTSSVAVGNFAVAQGEYSAAFGYSTRASGNYATAFGFSTIASGTNALAVGQATTADGTYSTTLGVGTVAKAYAALALGSYNDDSDNPDKDLDQPDDRIFQIGNGNSAAKRNAVTILRNGHVGLANVLAPNAPLHFNNDISNRKIILWLGANNDHQYYGLGINNGVFRYQVAGTGDAHVFFAGSGAAASNELFRISGNGNATLAGVLTQNSDETLKKNIEPIANASHLLQQLHGYRYQWKDANADADKQLGLLAQEVQKVLPELVKEGDNGKLGVNYSGLIPVLLEALKEQQMRIAELEKKLEKILSK